MEEDQSVPVAEGAIKSVKLSLSTEDEICTYSINYCPVTHTSQLGNPFLGLPLESGKCDGTGGNMSPSVSARGKKNSDGGDGTWEKQASSCKKNVDQASWGKKPAPLSRNSWGDKDSGGGDATWEKQGNTCEQNKTSESNEGSRVKANARQGSWGEDVARNNNTQQCSWDKMAAKDKDTQQDMCGHVATQNVDDLQKDSWVCVAAKTQTSTAEDVPLGSVAATAQISSAEHMDAQNDSWGNVAAKAQTSNNSKGWKSDGWAAKENRRNQRDNPDRPPMRPDERPPRQRFELPAEVKKILHEIDPIVKMVKKILRESRDGVRLPLEDEKFIKEKILEHHPEKEKKLSGEIDHIMVNKHHTFQRSRCFYAVSSDGTHTDFSYNKCIDNYVRKSYAEEHTELISQMYLKKRNRDRAAALDGGTTPVTLAEFYQSTPGETLQTTPQEAHLEKK